MFHPKKCWGLGFIKWWQFDDPIKSLLCRMERGGHRSKTMMVFQGGNDDEMILGNLRKPQNEDSFKKPDVQTLGS